MKMSILTLMLGLSIYVWLYEYQNEVFYGPIKDIDPIAIILLLFLPYIMFVLRTLVDPKPPLEIKIFESLLLLCSELSMIYHYYILFNCNKTNLFEGMKLIQLVVILLFLIIEYLVQVFMVKKSRGV
jgi:hypothetical protein